MVAPAWGWHGDLEADQVAAGVKWGGTEPVIFRLSQ